MLLVLTRISVRDIALVKLKSIPARPVKKICRVTCKQQYQEHALDRIEATPPLALKRGSLLYAQFTSEGFLDSRIHDGLGAPVFDEKTAARELSRI
ncbi:hypothetical protein LGM89_26700 [Burkholderia sp. AU31624]|uniref:hypothetical protein n=1 Tax=Burkholderia sp. AU31624 TaxID=2879629 RepID=UPI001CF5D70B|nr:hypothetical protein [Burkholderia sp. AU31624]MCA8256871.1 hypothetical protein [Burkholderia sp. AU31624]